MSTCRKGRFRHHHLSLRVYGSLLRDLESRSSRRRIVRSLPFPVPCSTRRFVSRAIASALYRGQKLAKKNLDRRGLTIRLSRPKARPSGPMSDSRQNLSLQFAPATLNFG
jgi:hypothetical protein